MRNREIPPEAKHYRLSCAIRAAIIAGDLASAERYALARDRAGKWQARAEVCALAGTIRTTQKLGTSNS